LRQVRFFLDADTEQPHIYNHGVTELEVIEVLAGSPLVLKGTHGSLIALGQTDSGRHLKVIYRDDKDDDQLFVITA